MSDLANITAVQPPEIPEEWDYERADREIDELIFQWRRLTIEVCKKLWVFYHKLARPGARTDLSPFSERLPTWEQWVREKGIGQNTPTRHFVKLGWLEKQDRINEGIIFPEGKYSVIYADPPWQYDNSGFDESAKSHYPTMPVEEICNLSISDLTTTETVLFLWATNPLLPEAISVMSTWGFTYKTNFVWVKNKGPSIGWFNQGRHELLLIGVEKENRHPQEKFPSWFEAEVSRHSKKPEAVYEMIESMYEGPYIELFARNLRKGWEAWGNEL